MLPKRFMTSLLAKRLPEPAPPRAKALDCDSSRKNPGDVSDLQD